MLDRLLRGGTIMDGTGALPGTLLRSGRDTDTGTTR